MNTSLSNAETRSSRPAKKVSFLILFCVALLGFLAMTKGLDAQGKNPLAGDPKAAKLGEFEFRANCAFCHGLGARGGGRGPDLTRAQKRHGNSDAEMFHNIHDGISGTAMPAATNGGIGVGMSDEIGRASCRERGKIGERARVDNKT